MGVGVQRLAYNAHALSRVNPVIIGHYSVYISKAIFIGLCFSSTSKDSVKYKSLSPLFPFFLRLSREGALDKPYIQHDWRSIVCKIELAYFIWLLCLHLKWTFPPLFNIIGFIY